jgi:hypothetical protein
VVPRGRSLDEYARIFDLTPRYLRGRILDCGGGPASFNAEATAAGHRIVSCDPLYRHSADDIRRRAEESSGALLENARAHRDRFVWREIRSPDHPGEVRMAAMGRFLADYPSGLAEGRYRTGKLPYL